VLEQVPIVLGSWAGWPNIVTCDRGLNNRGAFEKGLEANGVCVRNSGLEAPEQIGRGERLGGILKRNVLGLIKKRQIVGRERMEMMASTAFETKTDVAREGVWPCRNGSFVNSLARLARASRRRNGRS
jgi:hypothetical protein